MTISNNFNTIKLGSIEEGKKEIKVKDYVEFKQSKALGRLFTQIKLAFKGKGWLNKKSAKNLVQKMNWETMEKVYSQSQEILANTDELIRNTKQERPGKRILAGDDFTTTVKVTKTGLNKRVKKLKKEAAIASVVKDLVTEEVKKREELVRKDLTPLKHVNFDEFKSDKNLGPIFQSYLELLTETPDRDWLSSKPIHDHYGTINYAHTIVTTNGTRLDSQNRSIPTEKRFAEVAKREIDFDKLANYNKPFLVNGFIEYLVEGMVENNFTTEENKNIQLAIAARKLDQKIDNKKLDVYLMTGSQVLLQTLGKMNSFWENIDEQPIEVTDLQEKIRLTNERIDFLKTVFPSKEFESLIEMISVIATANAKESIEPHVEDALNHFFGGDTLLDCESGTDMVDLIKTTYEKITQVRDQTLLEISRDETLGEKFADFTNEFAKMIHSSNSEKQEKYFSRFPSIVSSSMIHRRGVVFEAERYIGYFIVEGRENKHVIENLDRLSTPTEEVFKTLFAEHLALKR